MRVILFIAIPSPHLSENGGLVSLLIRRRGWHDFGTGMGHLGVGEPSPTIEVVSNLPNAHPKVLLFTKFISTFGMNAATRLKQVIEAGKLVQFESTGSSDLETIWFGAYMPSVIDSIRISPTYGCLDVIGRRHLKDYFRHEARRISRVKAQSLRGEAVLNKSFIKALRARRVDGSCYGCLLLQGKELTMASTILDFFERAEKERRESMPKIHYAEASTA